MARIIKFPPRKSDPPDVAEILDQLLATMGVRLVPLEDDPFAGLRQKLRDQGRHIGPSLAEREAGAPHGCPCPECRKGEDR